jgi:SAM-dependent methyltransferase
MARETGCQVAGVDFHQAGVAAANQAAANRGMAGQARFLHADARQRLPLDGGAFDAVVCIDSVNHLYEREHVLGEWHRVLRPGGRALFTDPITIAGMLRREEMIIRSAGMGELVFTLPAQMRPCCARQASPASRSKTSRLTWPPSPAPGPPSGTGMPAS